MRFILGVLVVLFTVSASALTPRIFPDQSGHAGECLKTDGTGVLWDTCGGGGGGSSGATGLVQFSDGAGGFNSDSELFWHNTNKTLITGTKPSTVVTVTAPIQAYVPAGNSTGAMFFGAEEGGTNAGVIFKTFATYAEIQGSNSDFGGVQPLKIQNEGGNLYLGDAEHLWPATDGTSGQVLQTDGAGNLSFATPSGANTTLSNLTSPTSINQDLIPDTNNTRVLGSFAKKWNTIFAITMYDKNDSFGSAGQVLTADGAGQFEWLAPSGANTSLSNLSSVSINTALTNDGGGYNIGTSTDPWGILYLSSNIQDGSAVTAFDIGSRSIIDTTGNDSVDGNNRKLVGGATVSWATANKLIFSPATTGDEQVITTFDSIDPVPDMVISSSDGVSAGAGKVILRPGDGTGSSQILLADAPATNTDTNVNTNTFNSSNAGGISLSSGSNLSLTASSGQVVLDTPVTRFNNNSGGTPSNAVTPAGYLQISVDGVTSYVPYFQ